MLHVAAQEGLPSDRLSQDVVRRLLQATHNLKSLIGHAITTLIASFPKAF